MQIYKNHLCFFVFWMLAGVLVSSQTCNEKEFQCANGSCIRLFDVCDGTANCKDSSDEAYSTCFFNECPSYAFRCMNGGCINKSQQCDGKFNCVDKSDEHKLSCLGTSERKDYWISLKGNCSQGGTFQCGSTCIAIQDICNGHVDCDDGSDETEELCFDFVCPKYASRCKYGACIRGKAFCDGVVDCADGSDELDEICESFGRQGNNDASIPKNKEKPQSKPVSPSIRPTNSDKSNTTPAVSLVMHGVCQIPTNIRNVILLDDTGETEYKLEQQLPAGTVIKIKCIENYALNGKDVNVCYEGTWLFPFPTCREACSTDNMLAGISTVPYCYLHERPVNCGPWVAFDTEIEYMCAQGYNSRDDKLIAGKPKCLPTGKWSSMPPKCEATCGQIIEIDVRFANETPISNADPWQMSLFKRDTFDFNYVCAGTLISAKVVLSAGSCFPDKALANNDTELSTYKLVEGQNTNFVRMTDYRMHSLDEIINSSKQRQGDAIYTLVFLVTKDAFIFSNSLVPACLQFNRAYKAGITKRLQPTENTVPIGGPYSEDNWKDGLMTHVVFTKNIVVNIAFYKQEIDDIIAKYNYVL